MTKLEQMSQQIHELENLINKWMDQGYTPTIEKQIALKRLEDIYEQMLDLKNLKSTQAHLYQANELELESNTQDAPQSCVIPIENQQAIIDELFQADHNHFQVQIARFQQMNSLEEALIYISENYNWSHSNPLAIEFTQALEKYYQS